MGLHIDRPFSIIYNRQGIEQGIEQGIKQVVINMFHQNVLSAGASGAICGLLGYYVGKTKKNFITFCSPEATEHIVQYLIGRDAEIRIEYEILQNMYESETNPGKKQRLHDQLQRQPHRLERTHKLFDISDGHLSASFRKISNKHLLAHLPLFKILTPFFFA